MLSDLRVLDLSTMIAAPMSASLLADLGADVIKVERPGPGDPLRAFGTQAGGEGLYWKTLSRNKHAIALDLHSPQAQDIVRRLCAQADVLIENFRPGTLERWNLSPTALREKHPALVVLRVTAYGQDGPYSDRPGFGTLAEALAGLGSVSGFPDREPLLPAYPLADILAGHLGAYAVLAAVHHAKRSGRGDVIDLAIYESALRILDMHITEHSVLGTEHERAGNRIGSSAPRGVYLCADDRWIALSGSTPSVAERVLRAVGGQSLVSDPRFQTNSDRVAHAAELDRYVGRWCAQRPRDQAVAELSALGCAVGPLESVGSMQSNAHVLSRGAIAHLDDPELGTIAMPQIAPRFQHAKPEIRHAGPRWVGADTRSILRSRLGLTDAQISELVSSGAAE